jgi:hypothetical protein
VLLLTLQTELPYFEFRVLPAVIVKSTVFWHVTLCSLEKAQWFGGTYHLPLEGQRISQVRNEQKQTASRAVRVYHLLLVWLTL